MEELSLEETKSWTLENIKQLDLVEIEELENDIVSVISLYVNVEQCGNHYYCECPFHKGNEKSLSIDQEKQVFKCFVCGMTGNAGTFITEYGKIPIEKEKIILNESI